LDRKTGALPTERNGLPVENYSDRRGRFRILDLFCCAGGAGMGYRRAGFEVVGIDIDRQPRYPFAFMQKDVTKLDRSFLREFDAIHASPPCQRYSKAQRLRGREHPDLIDGTRAMLIESGLPYVIENVPGAPLIDPVTLCGSSFPELRVYRHRQFETNWRFVPPFMDCCGKHHPNQAKMGRPPRDGQFVHVVGNFSGVEYARKAMGISWMSRDELREAIPPAFTECIGHQLIALLQMQRVAA